MFNKALPIFFEVLSESENRQLPDLTCEANIYISLIHELNMDFELAYNHLLRASEIQRKYKLQQFYSTILIRLASIHRLLVRSPSIPPDQIEKLKKMGFTASLDSTMTLAKRSVPFAQKYNNRRDENDANFLISACYSYKNQEIESIKYSLKQVDYYKKVNDLKGLFATYMNVSTSFQEQGRFQDALSYSDSTFVHFDRLGPEYRLFGARQRGDLFKKMNLPDSAYHYLELAYEGLIEHTKKQQSAEIRKLEEEYQNAQKEETIRNKNRQIVLTSILAIVLLGAAISYIFKNREIKTQARIIEKQVNELRKSVEQKEILLSELQHRVKNNLQYVISILEIQKESLSHNNIEELIISNQNRIHSIALLHKKVKISDNVDEVNFQRYISELAELVRDSYFDKQKRVELLISSEIETLLLREALPLGLIIVELVSNSLKHAFNDTSQGQIHIEFTHDTPKKHCLHYRDSGSGIKLKKSTGGLGLEIINGLIDQLDGTVEEETSNGFNLKMYF